MYFLRRILQIIPVLLIVSVVAFTLLRFMKGSPFDLERAPATPEIERNLKAKFHLDEPIWKQYMRYMGIVFVRDANGNLKLAQTGVMEGDFGPSTKYRNHTVNDILAEGLPVSMTLGALAFCFAMGTGIPLGIYSAMKRGQLGDRIAGIVAMLTFCVPNIVIAPFLILFISIKWHLLPVAMWISPAHVILPTIILGLYFTGRVARLMREGLSTTMHAEFINTARAKGLSEAAILWKHGLRLAILPVVSYAGPMLADLLTGSFVVEAVFQIPGIGVFFINSISNRDSVMACGLILVYAFFLLTLNLVVDFSYSMLDRRVRYE